MGNQWRKGRGRWVKGKGIYASDVFRVNFAIAKRVGMIDNGCGVGGYYIILYIASNHRDFAANVPGCSS